jgi:hypothetical protein
VVVTAALVALAAVKAAAVAVAVKATAKKSHRCSEFIKLGASA